MTATLTLRAGKERSLLRRHPWVYDSAINNVKGNPASGDTVAVHGADGTFLAWAAFNLAWAASLAFLALALIAVAC